MCGPQTDEVPEVDGSREPSLQKCRVRNAFPPTRPDPADSPSSNPSDAGCPQNPWVRCAEYGYCVSFPAWGAGNAYLLDMGEERPGELTGQISINELLIAMGEEPVVSMMDLVVPDDASSITDEPPALPGL